MSEKPDNLTPEEREDLIAYLDGELSEDRAQEVEATLNRDPAAREEAQALQRTWDMLDYLPRPKAPESFTNQTMERLATQTFRRAAQQRWLLRISWAASVAAAALISFFITFYFAAKGPDQPDRPGNPSPGNADADVPAELRFVVENHAVMARVPNIQFAEKLAHPDFFGEEP